jgi:ribose-phosphate pyrophosphokinase
MLFVQDQYQYLVDQSTLQQHYTIGQFANGEYTIKLESFVVGQKCTVIGSLTASADQAMQLLLLLATLKRSGALHVTLFSPYLSYQRQDAMIPGLSQGLCFADDLLRGVGVDQVITIEPHTEASLTSLQVPVYAYSAESIFEQDIARLVAAGFGFVIPDAGAVMRYAWLFEKFPAATQGYFLKTRLHGMVQLTAFEGKVGRKVIVYDDILDSGQTLMQICIALKTMGVEEIVIFVTHAFFHGNAWQNLFDLGVIMLYCTNSVPAADQIKHLQIQAKSIAFLLQKSI